MSPIKYELKLTQDQRWGIYQNNRLLATVGNYEACQSILQSLQTELSHRDNLKSIFSYRKAIDKNLLIN